MTRNGSPRPASQRRVPSVLPSSTRMISWLTQGGMVLRRLSTISWERSRQLNSGVMTLIRGVRRLLVGTGRGLLLTGEEPAQVLGVARLAELRDVRLEPRLVDPALAPCDLLHAGDLETLTVLDHMDELGGIEERVVRPRVQPGRAPPEDLGVQEARIEVEAVQVRDLELAALGGLQAARARDGLAVVEVDARHREIRPGLGGFLLEREDPAVLCELDDAVGGGVGHVVAEYRRALGPGVRRREGLRQVVAVEEVVPEDERARRAG